MFKDRQFLLEVRSIAVPITIQSMVLSLLLTVDQLMVGRLGETVARRPCSSDSGWAARTSTTRPTTRTR